MRNDELDIETLTPLSGVGRLLGQARRQIPDDKIMPLKEAAERHFAEGNTVQASAEYAISTVLG